MIQKVSYRILLDGRSVKPLIPSSISKDFEKESNQVFFRGKLNGKFRFMRDDYLYILSKPKTHKFEIEIEACFATNYTSYWKGYFYKTDCEEDFERENIIVQPELDDDYRLVLDGLEKEFDLIKLAPERMKISASLRGVLQIYCAGQDTLTNIVGSTYFEQPCTSETSHSVLTETYKFTGSRVGLPVIQGDVECKGQYNIHTWHVQKNLATEFISADGKYLMKRVVIGSEANWVRFEIYRLSDNAFLYHSANVLKENLDPIGLTFKKRIVQEVPEHYNSFWYEPDPYPWMVVFTCSGFRAYARYLTNNATIEPTYNFEIPSTDIVDKNYNYTRIYNNPSKIFGGEAYNGAQNILQGSADCSTEPTEFGLYNPNDDVASEDVYYTNNTPQGFIPLIPICRSEWVKFSLFMSKPLNSEYLKALDTSLTIRVAYKLSSVISKLLQAIGSTVTHLPNIDHSNFLYGTANPLGVDPFTLSITPKSNILNTNYDKSATKAKIKFSEVLNMLELTYGLKWHIEGGKFILENYKYYNNGNSYSNAQQLGEDLTQLEYKLGYTWAYGRDMVTYNKAEMPERIEYNWMDEQSTPFDGVPIVINSPFVQSGNVLNKSASMFSSDIDMMLVQPAEMSKEGFALFACKTVNSIYTIPIGDINLKGYVFTCQNYLASFVYMHPIFQVYNLPAESVNINGEDLTIQVYNRYKVQKVSFPVVEDCNPMFLIKTNLGSGAVDKLSINLLKRFVTGTIKHSL